MPFVRMPDAVRVADMMIGREPDWWSTWTTQPGTSDEHHAIVRGAGPVIAERGAVVAAAAVRAAIAKVPSLASAPVENGLVQLRDYQLDAVNAVCEAWARGAKAPLIVGGCGCGKTIIASELISRVYAHRLGKSLFLAHRKELLDQTAEKVRLVSPRTRVGVVMGKLNELGREVTVASIQTVGGKSKKRLRGLLEAGPYDLAVLDECHHSVSPQNLTVIDALRAQNPEILFAGLTATPGRDDGLALDRVFDCVAYEKNMLDLVKEGWLVPPRGFRVDIDVKLDQVATDGGDFEAASLSKVMNTPHVNRAVVQAWMRYGHDRKMIVFAVDVAHAKALSQEFRDAGYAATHVDGTMKAKERQDRLDRFRSGEVKLLINCAVLTEGYDDPSTEGIVFARPTQSQLLYSQCLGRSLRLHPSKTEAIIIDCVGNSEKHQPVQLATLAGFDALLGLRGKKGLEEDETEESDGPTVEDATLGEGREVSITGRIASARYKWRETSLGWVLQIPKIGYYLVAWSDRHKSSAAIRFYDQRKGRRNDPPRVVSGVISFELAYGLVEAECDRIFRAGMRRKDDYDDEEAPIASFVDLDEGVDEETHVPEQWVLKDAGWRGHAITVKQRDLLLALGAKPNTMPTLAGEASDLITILRVERDAKMRLPATEKQLDYFRRWNIPIPENLTKGAAAKSIYGHRVERGLQEPRR